MTLPPDTMRAMVIHRHGGPEVLTVERAWPRPIARAGEIVVAVKACALNYLDIFTRDGMPGEPTPLPHITGGDVAGIVAETGPGVAQPAIGMRVLLNPSWTHNELLRLAAHAFAGRLTPVVDRVLPLERTAEGEIALANREVFGKVVIAP